MQRKRLAMGVYTRSGPESHEKLAASDGADGRLHYAVSPRFLLSCSAGLLRDAAAFAQAHALRVHTHAAEHPDEIAAVRARYGCLWLL